MPQPSKCTHGVDLDQDCIECDRESHDRHQGKKEDPLEDEDELEIEEEDLDEDEYDLGDEDELDEEDFEPPSKD